jgi:hypothetical protein
MTQQGNIVREIKISTGSPDTLVDDYVDKQGFFFRATTGGTIKYDPVSNDDGDYVTKTIDSSEYFNDCVMAKKIYASGTTAAGIYIGKGI